MLTAHFTGGRESTWSLPEGAWGAGTALQEVAEPGLPTPEERNILTIPILSPRQQWEIKWPVIQREYSVADAAATGAFVLDHTYLLDLLLEAYPKLASLFEPGCAIQIERVVDRDLSGRRYLRASVVTSLPVKDALDRMDRFAEEWWLTRIAEAGRDLVFLVDFA
jgi:hypothetical protein